MSTHEHEYRICDMCLHYYTPRIRRLTGAEPKVTLMPNWDGRGCDFDIFAFPANKTVHLPKFLMEKPEPMPTPARAQIEAQILWQLEPFLGAKPLKLISERLVAFRKQLRGIAIEMVQPILLQEDDE